MDHSELGPPKDGFRYKFLEPPEYEAVLDLIKNQLLSCMVPVGYDENHPEDWITLFRNMMTKSPLSYIAVHIESGEVAACRMVELVKKEEYDKAKSLIPDFFKYPANIECFKLCIDIAKDLNMFEKFGVTEYPEMFGLCVNNKYRQRGIAGEMYRRGLNFLQRRGYPAVKGSFISPFTRRAATKHGYQEFNRRHFHDCKDDQGRILNPESDPEEFIDFGYFDLRNREIKE